MYSWRQYNVYLSAFATALYWVVAFDAAFVCLCATTNSDTKNYKLANMSEYWKSTPRYWCKFCKVFVKDTKLERQQHDATPRHQGSIQKSLRSLHKEKEQEDRQKQRAKDEVARLNGVVGSSASAGAAGATSAASAGSRDAGPAKKATLEERKRQMQQLAEMGVAVPEEFRREMGMAGDWQTVKVTRVEQQPLLDEDNKDAKAFGVRKRKFEDQEEEEAILGTGDAAAQLQRKNRSWGARMKTFPGNKKDGDDDLDALLGGVTVKKQMGDVEEEATKDENAPAGDQDLKDEGRVPEVKKSDSDEEQEAASKLDAVASDAPVKTEDAADEKSAATPGAGIVFKKRKKIVR